MIGRIQNAACKEIPHMLTLNQTLDTSLHGD